jgi:hypothetical protein
MIGGSNSPASTIWVSNGKSMGLISEIVSWKLRLYVPTGAVGAEVLGRLLDRFPVARMLRPRPPEEPHDGQSRQPDRPRARRECRKRVSSLPLERAPRRALLAGGDVGNTPGRSLYVRLVDTGDRRPGGQVELMHNLAIMAICSISSLLQAGMPPCAKRSTKPAAS